MAQKTRVYYLRQRVTPVASANRSLLNKGKRHTCPVRAVEAWVEVLQIAEGPLFRAVDRHGRIHPTRLTVQSVALVVKRLIAKAGIASDYAGHSLRAGLATAAAAAGVPERAIRAQTGHRSLATLRKYIREGSLFLENAAAKVGL